MSLDVDEQAAFIEHNAPGMLGRLIESLATRFGVEPNEVGLTMFFCVGGNRVQMFSNLTEESVKHICAGYASRQGPLEAAAKTH